MNGQVLLTLVVHKSISEELIELLLEHPDVVAGFSTTEGDGHGSSVEYVGPSEHVRGRARRVRVQLITGAPHARSVLDLVRQKFANANVFYWMIPVLESGRCA